MKKPEIGADSVVIKFRGTKLIPQPATVVRGFWRHKMVPVPPLAEHVEDTQLPDDDLAVFDSYDVETQAYYELIGVWLYVHTDRYNGSWAAAYCATLDGPSVVWSTEKLRFTINPIYVSPQMVVREMFRKSSGKEVRLVKRSAQLEFPSKAMMADYLHTLDHGDEIIVAKLAAA